jgi:hypothetical protein
MHIGWFDDAIELANWDHIPAGFIQTSAIYDHAAAEAQRRGWPVTNLQGTTFASYASSSGDCERNSFHVASTCF